MVIFKSGVEIDMERLYQFLYSLGYSEPIHPAVVHIPIGVLACAFVLGALSFCFHGPVMGRAARYALIISFVSLFPAMFLGFTDWQHFFAGGWLFQVKMKLGLACVLLVSTFIAMIAGKGSEQTSGRGLALSAFCLLVSLGLGYFGGQVVYAGRVPPGPREMRAGERLFLGNCSGCHPYGGNIVDAGAPVRGAPPLKTANAFIGWIRDPRLDNGARGVMPPFLPSRIADAQALEMRRYILNVTGAKPDPACEATIPRIAVRTEPAPIERGRLLFQANCTACHTADSTQKIVGPGLKGVLKGKTLPVGNLAATPENIFRQLRCPYEEMPSFAGKLSDEQVFDLIAYLNTK